MEIDGVPYDVWSLSARRAWIEIKYVVKDSDFAGSLSARRAWIEMAGTMVPLSKPVTSLSARRAWIEIVVGCPQGRWQPGRSPQGERG